MLALHVLSAFAYVAGIVLFWVLIVAVRKADTPEGTIRMEPIVNVGNAAVGISLPGWILMRAGAEWIASRDGWTKEGVPSPTWLDIGGLLADLGGLILLVSLVVGGIGVDRLRQDKGAGLLRITLVLSLVLRAAYVVAVWAMAGKPE